MSTIADLQKKALILEEAFKAQQATAKLLLKELGTGAVPCSELRRYNDTAMSIHEAQFKLTLLLMLANAPLSKLPKIPGPIMFVQVGSQATNFTCRYGSDLVGPQQFTVIQVPDVSPAGGVPPLSAEIQPALAVTTVVLIIAGVSLTIAGAVAAKAAIDASKDKALSRDRLEALRLEAKLRQWNSEARLEFMAGCEGSVKDCAEAAVKAVEKLPKDFSKIGEPKFGASSKLAWLFGGGLAILGVLGGAWYYRDREKRRF